MAYGINGELVSDDRNLTRTTGLDFNGAPTGLMGGLDLNGAPVSPLGLQPMAPGIDFDGAMQKIQSIAQPLGGNTPPPEQSRMYYSPSTGEMVINGFAFNERNASAALASREALSQPARQFQLPDTANDWRPMSQQEYDSYIGDITNPGMGRRVSEAWEHAWRGYGDTNLGALLAVDPDNEWATTARQNLAREFEENAPFMLRLRDVQSPGQALEYTAQMFTQGVPWILDTIAWMAAGAAIGGVVSGGVGAPAGAVEAFVAREGIRRATAEALRNNLRRGATAYAQALERRGVTELPREAVIRDAVRAGTASADDVNRFFDFGERAYHLQRGGQAGAAASAFAGNYQTGVGEIRNAIADSGADPTAADSVANIWGMALPYAAIETLGDLIMTQPVTRLVPGMGTGPSRVGNALRHAGTTAASEGAEEMAQYGITQQAVANANNRPIDIEPYDLLEAGVGGALAGAPIGAVAGAIGPVTPRNAGLLPPPRVELPDQTPPPMSPPGGPGIGEVEMPEYPGNIFNPEELIPGQPSAVRTPGWPPPAPVVPTPPRPMSTAGLIPEVVETPRGTSANVYDAAIQAVITRGGRAGQAVQTINDAVRTGQYVPAEALSNLRLVDQEAMSNSFPIEHQAIALNLSEPLRQLAVQHNQNLTTELEGMFNDAANMATWSPEQQKRAQALAGSALIKGKDGFTAEQRKNISDFQGRLHQAIKSRATAPIAPVGNDGLRGRTEETVVPKPSKRSQERRRQRARNAELKRKEGLARMAEGKPPSEKPRGFNRRDQQREDQNEQVKQVRRTLKGMEDAARKEVEAMNVQERSTETISGKEQAGRSEATAKPDAGRPAATSESPKQESNEGVSERVDRAYKALVANSDGKKDSRQRVNAILGVLKKGRKINGAKNPWTIIDGKQLTRDELMGVLEKFGPTEKTKPEPKVEEKPEPKEDKKARRFGEDLSDAMKQSKTDPKAFVDFVLANIPETVEWMETSDARTRAGLRVMAERVLRDNPLTPQRAVEEQPNRTAPVRNSPKEARLIRLWNLILAVSKFIPRNTKANPIASRRELPITWRQLVVTNSNGEFRTEGEVNRAVERLLRSDSEHGKAARKLFRREDLAPKRAADSGSTSKAINNPMPKAEVRTMVNKAQATVNPNMKFRTTHVFEDVEDLWARANTEMMIAPNGAEVSIGRYIMGEVARTKLEFPDLKKFTDTELATAWVWQQLKARALVLPGYDALLVLSGYMESEREVKEVLEHEYIVHKGLSAIFENSEQRRNFLARLRSIPGMEEKRKELLAAKPGYKLQSTLSQIEEVLAFHSMEGPLALEKLMSAPQATDPVTKRTLWEDFKRIVMDWIKRVFGDTRTDADKVLDEVVSALRQHAMLGIGSGENLNRILDQFGAMSEQEIQDILNGVPPSEIQRATLTPSTPEETVEFLYGTPDNAGRPYTPTSWPEQMLNILSGNAELLEKAREVADKGVATPIKEGWKQIGRNLETMTNMEQRSTLIQKMMNIMRNTISVARRIMSEIQEVRTYATKAEEFAGLRKLWGDKAPGSTAEQRKAYNRMAIAATNSKMPLVSEEMIREMPRLVTRRADGMPTINMNVFAEYDSNDNLVGGLLKEGMLTKEEFAAGVAQYTVDKDGNATQAGTAKFDKETIDAGYDIYVAETTLMAKSKLKTLEHALIMLSQMNDTTVERLIKENEIKGADQAFLTEMLQHMYKLYADIAFNPAEGKSRGSRNKQKEKARQVLTELMRVMHSKEKLLDWTDASRTRVENAKNPRKHDAFKWRDTTSNEVKPFAQQIQWFLNPDPETSLNRLERLNGLGVGAQRQFEMLGAFQSLLNAEAQIQEHENKTIQQILGNYVEMTRNGSWRVFVNVKDAKTGERLYDVRNDMLDVLPVTYPKTEREAKQLQTELQTKLDAQPRTMLNSKGEEIEVTFDVGYGRAPGTRTLAEAPKIKEFLDVADITGIKLDTHQMKQIANLIENTAGRKRFGLQRAGTPGMDEDILKNNGITMTRNAWWAAKVSQAWMLDTVFADDKNVFGDWSHLKQLQEAFDIANRGAPEGTNPPVGFTRNEAQVYLAETALLRYANQLRYMAKTTTSRPTVDIRTTKGEQKFKIEPEAEAHLAHAVALRESLERNELELNLNDLLSKTGPLRMLAVVLQLGSIASGIMNAFTLITHLPLVLTARHSKTGYGEGFTFTETMAEIIKALTQVGQVWENLIDPAKVKELLDEAKKGNVRNGMTVEELEFLYTETLEGEVAAQQTYAMTGGTENNIANLWARNIAEAFLVPFGAVEAMNRRVAALATYRLAKARYLRAGVSAEKLNDIKSIEYRKLIDDINRVIRQSQGEYSNVNQPKAFRGDLAKYVLLYKMFPLMTTLMMYNLPKAQQAAFLGVLFLLGGLRGEPFAEDFMDLYDTLLQKLGFKHDSIELQVTRKLEEIMPGSSTWIMNGFIDNLAFGGTMSSRVSMGDILPMTGAFRADADLGREITNAFGPAYAANVASLEWAWLFADFAMQWAGIKDRSTDWRELIRKMPQAQLRAIGEASLMLTDGEITDPRGRLVSDEVTEASAFARALGFYPLEATRANNAVRLDRMHIAYMRNIRARYILAYAQAYRHDDQAEMERIADMVRDWNEAAREANDDSMLIRNFRSAAVRAGRAASSTTIERTSEGAPNYSLIDELAEIVNADTESEEE